MVQGTTASTPARLRFNGSADTTTAGRCPACSRPTGSPAHRVAGSPKPTSQISPRNGTVTRIHRRARHPQRHARPRPRPPPPARVGTQLLETIDQLVEEQTALKGIDRLAHEMGHGPTRGVGRAREPVSGLFTHSNRCAHRGSPHLCRLASLRIWRSGDEPAPSWRSPGPTWVGVSPGRDRATASRGTRRASPRPGHRRGSRTPHAIPRSHRARRRGRPARSWSGDA